jgi:fluoride ion exporter CrcB/FEX
MSSIISSGYALIDSSGLKKQQRQEPTDPYVSSLAKSVQILRQSVSNKAPPDDTLTSEALDNEEETDQGRQACTVALLALYLSAFSILGLTVRVFLGQLFDSVTSIGEAQSGGALFSDLPANMVGSFLMGFLQPSRDLDLLNNVPMAFLGSKHWFQSWGVVHIGLRTGFCGSLTTLASWNTQMVVMMNGKQILSAIFGYILGLEAALASLAFGQTVAVWMHRNRNPHLAREEDILMFAYSKGTNEPWRNKALPDYEMRYLASLLPREQETWAKQNIVALEDLERWKMSTDEYRTRELVDDEVLVALHEIERKVLVDEEEPEEGLVQIADRLGWDIQSLQKFSKEVGGTFSSSDDKDKPTGSLFAQRCWCSVPLVAAVTLLVAFGVLGWKSKKSSDFFKKLWLSALFAPFGTIIRWKLSALNGTLSGVWEWFPLGTFTANLVASAISMLSKGLLDSPPHKLDTTALADQFLSAIKTGFAGCMSTVSTFVVEANVLQKSFPHHAKAHYYMVGTLTLACIVGLIIYIPFV